MNQKFSRQGKYNSVDVLSNTMNDTIIGETFELATCDMLGMVFPSKSPLRSPPFGNQISTCIHMFVVIYISDMWQVLI